MNKKLLKTSQLLILGLAFIACNKPHTVDKKDLNLPITKLSYPVIENILSKYRSGEIMLYQDPDNKLAYEPAHSTDNKEIIQVPDPNSPNEFIDMEVIVPAKTIQQSFGKVSNIQIPDVSKKGAFIEKTIHHELGLEDFETFNLTGLYSNNKLVEIKALSVIGSAPVQSEFYLDTNDVEKLGLVSQLNNL